MTKGPRIEYMGLWEDKPHRAFSVPKSHRIKYSYEENGPNDEAFVKGWTVPKELFLDDLKAFVQEMKAASATVGYWSIQNGNEIYTRIGETVEYEVYGKSSELRRSTVPEESTESFELLLEGFFDAEGAPGPIINTKGGAWQNAVYRVSCCESTKNGPRIKYVGLWEDRKHPRALSLAKPRRIKYSYDDFGSDDEAFVKGWTVPKQLFLDDLKLFVEEMKAADATVGYWAIQDGNQIFTRIGETDDYKCYGQSPELRLMTTVPEKSTDSYELLLDGFFDAAGVPGPMLNTKGGAWQNAVYKISL